MEAMPDKIKLIAYRYCRQHGCDIQSLIDRVREPHVVSARRCFVRHLNKELGMGADQIAGYLGRTQTAINKYIYADKRNDIALAAKKWAESGVRYD